MSSKKRKLFEKLYNLEIGTRIDCSEEENKTYVEMKSEELPDDIFDDSIYDQKKFYRVTKSDLTDEDIKTLLLIKQTEHLNTIKFCVIFFVVLAIIGIIIGAYLGSR